MPKLIKNGVIVQDSWQPLDKERGAPGEGRISTLEQWQSLADKSGSAVQVEPGEDITVLLDALAEIQLVVINFPAFMDGRGFSYGRELRERGYQGELRAAGHFIRDQLSYLQRLGFDSFQMAEEAQLEQALDSLGDFSEYYQAAIDQPVPLFRRRS